MDQFEDQFLAENPDALGLAFEEDPKFFDPEAAHEAEAQDPEAVGEECTDLGNARRLVRLHS